jgi:hypothetical protein
MPLHALNGNDINPKLSNTSKKHMPSPLQIVNNIQSTEQKLEP